jgi:hypothetical protein
MFRKFEDLINSNNEDVVATAHIVRQLQNDLKAGKMSPDEFKESTDDLLDLSKIDDLASSIEHKAEMKQAFDFLKLFIKAFA